MSNKVKVELIPGGVLAMLKSREMMDVVEGIASNAISRLGDGYEMSSMTGTTRVNASVTTVTREARLENLETNSILKALK